MSSEPSLTDMPDVVLNKVLEYSDIRSILVLRKVCRNFRNYIDDVEPEANLTEIRIEVFPNICVEYRFSGGFYEIEYQKHEDGCLIIFENNQEKKEKFFKNQEILTIFSQDFQSILGFQNSNLEKFSLFQDNTANEIFDEILEIFKDFKKPRPLQVKLLDISLIRKTQLIELMSQNELFQLSKIFVKFSLVSPEDVVILKEIILQSPAFESLTIQFAQFLYRLQTSNLLGPVYIDNESKSSEWYFQFPNTTQILLISHAPTTCSIVFSRIESEYVPREAQIQY